MLDRVLVEKIRGEVVLTLFEPHLIMRKECKQETLAAAMRAVARKRLRGRIRVHREPDLPAMAAKIEHHTLLVIDCPG
jgi:hypothetical protein